MSWNHPIIHFIQRFALIMQLYFLCSCNPFQSISSISEFSSAIDQLSISSVNPSTSFILGGTTITVKGSGFQSGTTVTVGSYSCSSMTLVSSAELTCVLPSVSAPISMDISISNSKGSATLSSAIEYNYESFNTIELFSGNMSFGGSTNGTSNTAKLNRPSKPLVVGTDIYIADTDNQLIRKFDTITGITTTVAGNTAVSGTTDGTGTVALLNYPMGMTLVGSDIYFTDNGSCLIRKFNITTSTITTIAGIPYNCTSSDGSTGLTSSFSNPVSVISDGSYIYVADESLKIRRFSLGGSNAAESLVLDVDPQAVIDFAIIGNNLYFVDAVSTSSNIRYIDLTQTPPFTMNTLTSIPIRSGSLTTDGTDLYVGCPSSHVIKKYTFSNSTLSTIVGTGIAGNTDGTGTAATMHNPAFMDYSSGYIYFTSYGSHNLKKLNTSNLSVVTILGNTK